MSAVHQTDPAPARRILLVDDEPTFTDLLKNFLVTYRPGQWTVYTADGYSSALACLKQHSVDLVVLDLNMPVMDGLQFLSMLKRSYPELPVVIFTARASKESRSFCLQNGAALYLDKGEIANGFEKIYLALESVAAVRAEGFHGMLRKVGLQDVLQMECLSRKSSVLEIVTPRDQGNIFIQDGSIVHAESGTLQGEAALFRLLALKGGQFHLKPFRQPPRPTIDGQWESLLMEAARLQDEAAGAEAGDSAPVESPVEIPMPPPPDRAPAAEKGTGRSVEEIVLCSGAGEVLYTWQTADVERRLRLFTALAARSAAFESYLPVGPTDRLEIEMNGGRIIILLQPERKLFVHIGLEGN